MIHWTPGTPATSWWAEATAAERERFIRRRLDENATAKAIAAEAGVAVSDLRVFAWRHNILGLSNRMIDRSRVAQVPDDREIDPDAWKSLGQVVDLLTNTGCSWPVDGANGKQGCCGHPKERRGSYCSTHRTMAYRRG